ncbi:2OG-Fe(II) oxygenase [Pedobacter antarcticus]|uniref:2OG-Fe(II) oxygenase n=1 Tax=Pedobacter antarcticus TaxID=34086 RepID=UPI001C578208|nr:2OG-Fe(II) oxygenase [Pedobacter antarcticus]
MQNEFQTLIDGFITDQVGISTEFFPILLAKGLRDNILQLKTDDLLKDAGTGNAQISNKDKLVRSDQIHWLDRSHENISEQQFFILMDKFILYLNSTCYTGITGYEFHYTLYEKGSFYKTHLDQFNNNQSRKYSMIIYLNENWIPEDGGELCIHHPEKEQQLISPDNRKGVFFKSNELPHEVLISHRSRMSITGWLKVTA